jgi:hypothetical protein
MLYLVTTKVSRIPADHQIVMVDGTVPGWRRGPQDLHWDHHRPKGADIQIDEMPVPTKSLREDLAGELPPCIVTPQLDADACCAAAWFQLPRTCLQPETVARLRAIAWDCDHLIVPEEELSQWAEFAAKAVAALKTTGAAIVTELQLPKDRHIWSQPQWETYFSEGFKRGTEWLVEAARGKRPWPGERGEADNYRQEIERDASLLLTQNRIQLLPTPRGAVAVGDLRDIGRYIDPKSLNQAIASLIDLETIRPETLLVREHKYGGIQYTLGCLPAHPQTQYLDYTAGIFERLTQAELAKDPSSEGWGGRRTVGGSGWNTPSYLTPEEAIALLDEVGGS